MGVRISARASLANGPRYMPCATLQPQPGTSLSAAPTCGNQSSCSTCMQPACGPEGPGGYAAPSEAPQPAHSPPVAGHPQRTTPPPHLQPPSSKALSPLVSRLPMHTHVSCMLPAHTQRAAHCLPCSARHVPACLAQSTPLLAGGQTTASPVGSKPLPSSPSSQS